ncbi:FAD/NAD(P)-binding domain-containing protein [Setomelanomma holmii]|uniref:FAD/NAD(P)-binding domain-containing protein n=1 Tax=Setomelanomma holmii TaxID=210430 RepID=A0A9P4GZP5_9PLEO|nr:FAD/NAD(P)-binding domain-containing protein [Setomelanomma holmii]
MSAVIESNDAAMPAEQKYFVEAAKRKRADGTKQFEQIHFSDNDRLRSLADDPFADHAALDNMLSPINDGGRVKFLILGAGMGGIVMAIRLIKQGFSAGDIVLIETAGGVGGTWYWNRYPGLHCDVEAYCYLPLLEETGYMPKEKYASSVEIRTYLENIVKRFGLDNRILFRSQVSGLEWDEGLKAWKTGLTVRSGPSGTQEKNIRVHADFVTLASGLFPYPQVPRVQGISDFKGEMFHTSRWNYKVTGGSSNFAFPEMDKLRGKRVGIIGTGATAIQVVPQLAKYAQELYVFQRTPSQVNSRGQRNTDPAEWRNKIAAKPGWQRERMENLAEHLASHKRPGEDDLVDDEWSKLEAYCALIGSNRFGRIAPDKAQEHIGQMMALDAAHTQKARERIATVVKDKDTARQLTPWYPTWCKRPTFSDMYLETFNNSHVHLVDTDGKGIDSVTPNGIVANGQEHAIDILVLSTGYRSPTAGGDPGGRMGIEIVGREGRTLSKKWEDQGISTLHGVFSNGFPNLFFQSAAQAAATANYMHVLEVLSEHIASLTAQASKRAASMNEKVLIEPSSAAEDAWGMQIAQGAVFFSATVICTPSYLNLEGEAFQMPDADDQVAMMKKAKAAIWQGGLVEFTRKIEEWRGDGKLEGVEVTMAA